MNFSNRANILFNIPSSELILDTGEYGFCSRVERSDSPGIGFQLLLGRDLKVCEFLQVPRYYLFLNVVGLYLVGIFLAEALSMCIYEKSFEE